MRIVRSQGAEPSRSEERRDKVLREAGAHVTCAVAALDLTQEPALRDAAFTLANQILQARRVRVEGA